MDLWAHFRQTQIVEIFHWKTWKQEVKSFACRPETNQRELWSCLLEPLDTFKIQSSKDDWKTVSPLQCLDPKTLSETRSKYRSET